VASVFPREEWEDLAEQLQEDAWVQVADASDKKRPIIQLDEDPFDFHREEVEGFAGATSGPIGQMFLLRPRSDAGQEGATIPWNAIITGAILSFIIASLLALWITR